MIALLARGALKQALFQYAEGDTQVPNPTETALVRTANLRETTSFHRHDLTLKLFPELNPAGHYFSIPYLSLFGLTTDPLAQYLIAMLAQEQAAGFLASDGTLIPDGKSSPAAGRHLGRPAITPSVRINPQSLQPLTAKYPFSPTRGLLL